MNGLKQKTAHQLSEPPANRLLWIEVNQQHLPCLLVTCEEAQRKGARLSKDLEPVWEHGFLPPSLDPKQFLGTMDPA